MLKKQYQKENIITWKQYSNKGYSAFASLGKKIRIGVLAVTTLATVTPVQAETQALETKETEGEGKTLEEVSVTATMAPLTEIQQARIVTLLTREEIQQAGIQSVNDLLKLTSGVDVRQRGGFGIQTDISIDGGTFDQITLLLNGINISNPHTGHLAADLPLSPDDIERIEILQGASSRVYGGSSFGGCINIVTRKDTINNISARAEGGSFVTFQADGRGCLKLKQVANRISTGGGRSNGGTDNSQWKKAQLYYQGDFSHEAFTLDWQFGFSKKNYGANTFYSAAYPNQYERNERYTMSVSAETKNKIHFTPSVYWNRTYDNFELIHGKRFGENFHQTDVYGLKLGGYLNWRAGKTAFGTEIRNEGILSTNLGKQLDEAQYSHVRGNKDIFYDHKDNRTNISYCLEHNILLQKWTLSMGVVANMNTAIQHRFYFYPGADMSVRPAPNWTIYASYNNGFRLPTFTDLYYKSPTLNGNTDLKSEENHSVQLGTQYTRAGSSGTLRVFYHRGRHMIDWVMYNATDIYHATNFNLDNMGVQAETKLNFEKMTHKDIWLKNLSVSYTFMHQKRHDHTLIYKSNYALEYLRHKLVVSMSHKIYSRLTATWHLRWQDRMGAYLLYQNATNTGKLTPYKPYVTLDMKIQWTERLYTLYLQGTNITNCKYYDMGNVPQPSIWILAGAQIHIDKLHTHIRAKNRD
ncbi:MAG: TonB-dependent receptor [Bacteroidaceae bacterium]|nr:TonB-dependent receptor [Bacteroidaceae bacterium]